MSKQWLDPRAAYQWKPDSDEFWRGYGHQQTERLPVMNLLLLAAGGSVWMIWAVLGVLLMEAGYPFSLNQLFSLLATSAMAALCARLSGSFILHHCGTRYALLLNTYLLLVPVGLLYHALNSNESSYTLFVWAAITSGFGAGLLTQIVGASCILFPLKMRPLVQEVPLALANIGLIFVLVAVPLLVQWQGAAWLGIQPTVLLHASSNISGKVDAGRSVWLGASLILPFVLILAALWHVHRSPSVFPSTLQQGHRIPWRGLVRSMLLLLGAAFFCWLLQWPDRWLIGLAKLPAIREVMIIAVLAFMLIAIRFLAQPKLPIVSQQLQIVASREVNLLGLMYLMGMGSLLGFALSFPLMIKAIFGLQIGPDHSVQLNPVAPAVLIYGWLPVVLGLVARAAGSWLAQRIRPSLINQVALLCLLVSSIYLAYLCSKALHSPHPEQLFLPFFICSLTFFVAAGMFAGSVMNLALRTLPRERLESALTWIITLAGIGAYYIPRMYADNLTSTGPGAILVGFAVFYFIGMLINWFFYLRKHAELSLP